ncbi:hypothetical protein PRIPAC_71402 [Pristionchus pacificus]|uniref:Uncharacterized protein n=1 Tax=Pristionchus pacificus TaxID=54126 RepID=A0A2A6C831_PRIPA|nr:hypothetical protein PRIPAC_71402 [Pristionchus pacificus]|eukprot:PDM74344.1 hypothetical protein PRIPAC_41700 [Pristionchus pacificus]
MYALRSLIQASKAKCESSANQGEPLAPVIAKALDVLERTSDANYDHDRVVSSLDSFGGMLMEETREQTADPSPVPRELVVGLLTVTHAALTEVTERRKHDDDARMVNNLDPECKDETRVLFMDVVEWEDDGQQEDEQVVKKQKKAPSKRSSDGPKRAPRGYAYISESSEDEDDEEQGGKKLKVVETSADSSDDCNTSVRTRSQSSSSGRPQRSRRVDYARLNGERAARGDGDGKSARPKRTASRTIDYAEDRAGSRRSGEEMDTGMDSRPASRACRVDYARLSGVTRTGPRYINRQVSRSASKRRANSAGSRGVAKRARTTSPMSSSGSQQGDGSSVKVKLEVGEEEEDGGETTMEGMEKGEERVKKTPQSAAKKKKKSTPKGYMYLTESDSSEEEEEEVGDTGASKKRKSKNPAKAYEKMQCTLCSFRTSTVFQMTAHLRVEHQTTVEKERIWFKCECGHMGRSNNHSQWNQCGGKRTTILQEDPTESSESSESEEEEDGEKEEKKKKDEDEETGKDESEEEEEEMGEEEEKGKEEGGKNGERKAGGQEMKKADKKRIEDSSDEEESSLDNPLCFLCKTRSKSCDAFLQHLRLAHRTTPLAHGYTIVCACGIAVNPGTVKHLRRGINDLQGFS